MFGSTKNLFFANCKDSIVGLYLPNGDNFGTLEQNNDREKTLILELKNKKFFVDPNSSANRFRFFPKQFIFKRMIILLTPEESHSFPSIQFGFFVVLLGK